MNGQAAGPGREAPRVFVRRRAVEKEVCCRIRAAMDAGATTAAEVYVEGYVVDERVRRARDVSVDSDIVSLAERLIDAIRPDVSGFFGVALEASEGPGFLTYCTGDFYRAHRDVGGGPGDDFPRRVSVVLFLTDAGPGSDAGRCQGGALRLHGVSSDARPGEPLDIAPEVGMLVAFPSDLLHEVLPVTGGVRDVVVDWFF